MTWLDIPPDHPFGVNTLPYCHFSRGCFTWLGARIGDQLVNLRALEDDGLLGTHEAFSKEESLNRFLSLGRGAWTEIRERLTGLLTGARHRDRVQRCLFPLDAETRLLLPFEVADYVDFYSSEEHATNLGRLFRPGSPPLPPNWKHLPVGYHGRAGTVVGPDHPIVRPSGQRKAPDADAPTYGPSARLDVEAELGFVVGEPSEPGPVAPDQFADHVFGAVLVNDWSARDIQAWEYQPLGPFLGKSFATSVSPWLVPLDALSAAKVPAPPQDPPPLGYLRERERFAYDITLEVRWNGTLVSRPPFAGLYWTPAQQLAHMTANGAWLRTGDLFASGTISGPARDQRGSFIELTWNGAEPVRLADGTERSFLLDGDTVSITATAPGPDGSVIGFGDVTGTVSADRPVP